MMARSAERREDKVCKERSSSRMRSSEEEALAVSECHAVNRSQASSIFERRVQVQKIENRHKEGKEVVKKSNVNLLL